MLVFDELSHGLEDEFNEFVARNDTGSIRQTTHWGEIKANSGWKPRYYTLRNDGRLAGTAAVLERRVPGTPSSLMYCCRGPITDWQDQETAGALIGGLAVAAKERRGICLRMDPEPVADSDLQEVLLLTNGALKLSKRVTRWNRSLYSVRVPLIGDEDALFSGIRSRFRTNIRKAIRSGVSVSAEPEADDPDRFFELMTGLEERRDTISHERAYYDRIYQRLIRRGSGLFLKARYQGKVISGCLLAVLDDKAWLLYVANDYEYRRLSPNKLLYWEAIKRCRDLGCRFLDLGATQGIATFDPDNDPLDFFRKGFGPEVVTLPGYFDLPGRFYRSFVFAEGSVLPMVARGYHEMKRLLKSR